MPCSARFWASWLFPSCASEEHKQRGSREGRASFLCRVEVLIHPALAVAPLPHSARDYVRAFDLTCIALWRDGRLGVSRNPTGADQAWWCPAKAAGAIVRAANANGRDVVAAAARLHTPVTPHDVVAERAGEATRRIDVSLTAAQRAGRDAPHTCCGKGSSSNLRQRDRSLSRKGPLVTGALHGYG